MAQACYPFFLAGSWGVVEVILFFLLFGVPTEPCLSCVRLRCGWGGGSSCATTFGHCFWSCLVRDVAHGPSPRSSCASTLERSLVLLFRFAFWGGALGQVLPQFLCKQESGGSCGTVDPLCIMFYLVVYAHTHTHTHTHTYIYIYIL